MNMSLCRGEKFLRYGPVDGASSDDLFARFGSVFLDTTAASQFFYTFSLIRFLRRFVQAPSCVVYFYPCCLAFFSDSLIADWRLLHVRSRWHCPLKSISMFSFGSPRYNHSFTFFASFRSVFVDPTFARLCSVFFLPLSRFLFKRNDLYACGRLGWRCPLKSVCSFSFSS